MSTSQQRLITVFGSHNPVPESEEYKLAESLGAALSSEGYRCATGGYGGIMEGVLKGAGGGIGFTASIFSAAPNAYVTETIESQSLLERIQLILDRSDGFVCMTGGTGTLLELAAAWEMVNKKMIDEKPIVCLGRFWHGVIKTLAGEPTIDNIHSLRNQKETATRYVHQVESAGEVVQIMNAFFNQGV